MSIRSARSKSERDGTGLVCVAISLLALALAAPAARSDCGAFPVRVADLGLLRDALLCASGSSCYDPRVDYDSDGVVGVLDFGCFKRNLGRDLTPPVVAIVSPLQNQVLSGVAPIAVWAGDDLSVPSVSIFFEGVDPYPPKTSGPPYRLMLDTRTIPNGMQVISANAVDAAGNRSTHRVAVLINNPMPPPAAPGLVIADDLNGDGRYSGQDLKIALARCAPGCTLRALARTYDDVELVIPAAMTYPVIIEGAGMGQTVFRSPVPWKRPVFTVSYPNPLVTFRDLTIDGRKGEQISAFLSNRLPHDAIRVANPWAADMGPGIIERVEVENMLNSGVSISGGSHWIVRHSKIHDDGCSQQFPCPNLAIIDPGALLNDPNWKSIGYGIVVLSSENTVHENEIWNINKIGIEAGWGTGFHFHHNHVHHSGSGIVSNGASGGLIEDNVVAYSIGHGVVCGGQAGELVFNGNLISDSSYYGLWVGCMGPNITVSNNVIENNCRTMHGGGAGLHVHPGKFGVVGNGIAIQGNRVVEPFCGGASTVAFRNDVQISGNEFRGGTLATVGFQDATNIVLSDTQIDGENRVPTGIYLLQNVDGVTVGSDVTMTGYTRQAIVIANPTTVTNVVVE